MLSSFGIIHKESEMPSSSRCTFTLDDDADDIEEITSDQVEDHPFSLFNYLYSAVSTTFKLLTGNYGVSTSTESNSTDELCNKETISQEDTISSHVDDGKISTIPISNGEPNDDSSSKDIDTLMRRDTESPNELLEEREQEEEALGEVFCKMKSKKLEIAEATKVLEDSRTYRVEGTMEDALAMYDSALEQLHTTKKEAKDELDHIMNRKYEQDDLILDVESDGEHRETDSNAVRATAEDSNKDDSDVSAMRHDDPYRQTLARLQNATSHVQQFADDYRNKLQEEVNNCVEGTSQEAQAIVSGGIEEEEEENDDSVNSYDEELLNADDDVEIVEEEIDEEEEIDDEEEVEEPGPCENHAQSHIDD